VSWDKELFEPIEIPDGRVLRTLRDAGQFIQELPKTTHTHDRPEWQDAVEALLLVVECDGDTLLAYIGIKRALNAGRQLEPAPRRKRAKAHKVIRQSAIDYPKLSADFRLSKGWQPVDGPRTRPSAGLRPARTSDL
jgi:hypothetical protein